MEDCQSKSFVEISVLWKYRRRFFWGRSGCLLTAGLLVLFPKSCSELFDGSDVRYQIIPWQLSPISYWYYTLNIISLHYYYFITTSDVFWCLWHQKEEVTVPMNWVLFRLHCGASIITVHLNSKAITKHVYLSILNISTDWHICLWYCLC